MNATVSRFASAESKPAEPSSFRSRLAILVLALAAVAAPLSTACAQSPWKLAWSDEFNGQRGAPPNPANWAFETGPGAKYGNQEAEFYCAYGSSQPPCKPNLPNAYLDGSGHLILVAVKTTDTLNVGSNITSPIYTSARLRGLQSFRYGRIEASLRLPTAEPGVWPAFWALGVETSTVHWPTVGEIDIMEQWNPVAGQPNRMDPLIIHGSTHGPKSPASSTDYLDQIGNFTFPRPPSNGLHQYAVEWEPGEVDFYVDGYLFSQQSVGSLSGSDVYALDRNPFNLLLNLAMGGGFFGYPNASTGPTPTFVADYVRVYQRNPGALPADWGNADIGGPAEPGSSAFASGVWTVAGSGRGITGSFDQFQFLYHSLGSNSELSAHVLDQTSKISEAKAGIMLRKDRGAASPFAMMFVAPDGSTHFRCRLSQGVEPVEVLSKTPAAWLKIGRDADTFTGYTSTDGKSWNAVGSVKIPMSYDLDAGLIATSRDNAAPNIARFDYVDLTDTDAAFDGHAAQIPGVIQAERFDTGGKGYSYSAEFGDTGPTIAQMPDKQGSDDSAGGFYLTNLKAGRYINYSVDVTKEGDYIFNLRAASSGPGGSVHLNMDQKPLFAPMQIPDTGGGLHWRMLTSHAVHLTPGHHTIALVTDSPGSGGHVAPIDLFAVQPK
jgi:beta-glucanase (GH16 family)